ncbi:hypothetical protein CBR_g40372 [Chara braunii]|uniref:Uncharacterized protein n=1 Tax=Chara braunii TaxID=69332 RepID=A0A388LTS6_CHABU|nr:hypothetical protein CBR_g40372 [Chara braunii]|eukprot:GBG85643.1 hypothetical protein CBR_g40372 [Chara braunii]
MPRLLSPALAPELPDDGDGSSSGVKNVPLPIADQIRHNAFAERITHGEQLAAAAARATTVCDIGTARHGTAPHGAAERRLSSHHRVVVDSSLLSFVVNALKKNLQRSRRQAGGRGGSKSGRARGEQEREGEGEGEGEAGGLHAGRGAQAAATEPQAREAPGARIPSRRSADAAECSRRDGGRSMRACGVWRGGDACMWSVEGRGNTHSPTTECLLLALTPPPK